MWNKMIGYPAFFRRDNSERSSSVSSAFAAKRASLPTCREPQLRILTTTIAMLDRRAKGGSGFEISMLLIGLNQSWEAQASRIKNQICIPVVMVHDCELRFELQIQIKHAACSHMFYTGCVWYAIGHLGHKLKPEGSKSGTVSRKQVKHELWVIFKLRINYVILRRSLRVCLGYLRGFSGVSTATGWFTGYLCPKTRISNPRSEKVPKVFDTVLNFLKCQLLEKLWNIASLLRKQNLLPLIWNFQVLVSPNVFYAFKDASISPQVIKLLGLVNSHSF